MRTTVLNYVHTFHPEARAEIDRLAAEERRLSAEKARRAEGGQVKRRLSEPTDDIDADLDEVAALIAEQREVVASGVVRLVVKGLTRGEFRRLLVAHPPREDDQFDMQAGYNVDTFGEELIRACIVDTLAHELNGGEPVENEWDRWADEMTNGQWEEIFRACLRLTTEGSPAVPRSPIV